MFIKSKNLAKSSLSLATASDNLLHSSFASISSLIPSSKIATLIQTIPGFAHVSAGSLAGEIVTLERFESEASLALYLGVTNLDNSSGKSKGSKRNLATNRQAKMAMITATMKHTQHVEESKKYIVNPEKQINHHY